MTLPAIAEDWTLSEVGMKIHDVDMPLERFTEICYTLGRFHEAVRFAIGDAIIQGEHLFGDDCHQALEEMNLSEDARQEYVRVAQRVPPSIRVKGLSWSHHRAVAALGGKTPDHEEQKKMLKRAKTLSLSHHALREELRNGAEAKASTVCRCCGRSL